MQCDEYGDDKLREDTCCDNATCAYRRYPIREGALYHVLPLGVPKGVPESRRGLWVDVPEKKVLCDDCFKDGVWEREEFFGAPKQRWRERTMGRQAPMPVTLCAECGEACHPVCGMLDTLLPEQARAAAPPRSMLVPPSQSIASTWPDTLTYVSLTAASPTLTSARAHPGRRTRSAASAC